MSQAKAPREKKEKFWLHAFRSHLAGLRAYTNCIETADINGDGDYKLIVADGSKKLKIFGGTSLQTESRLLSAPSAVTSFHMDTATAFHRPVVAVAVGPYIFMYQSNKPLYRFTVPMVPVHEKEQEVWRALAVEEISTEEAVRAFETQLDEGIETSNRTLELLLMDDPEERQEFIMRVRDEPLQQFDVITCMSSLKLEHASGSGNGCLLFGTEHRFLYVLRNQASEVALKVVLPSAAVFLITAGSFNVDYRIIVSCRDGRIYSIKNGKLHSSVIQPDAQPAAVAQYDNLVAVATTINTISYYTLKGKRQSTVYLPTAVTNMTTMTDPVTGAARGLVAALGNGELRVYVGTSLQHVSQVYGTVTAMYYGCYGREDSALILVLQNGSLVVQLLHRNVNLSATNTQKVGPPPEQNVPIPVPHLNSVFTAQTEREKQYSLVMYRTFQYDLCHLRLLTARAYLGVISNEAGSLEAPVAAAPAQRGQSLAMQTSVQGLGPVFKIKVLLQNILSTPQHHIMVVFSYPAESYRMPKALFSMPCLMPSLSYPCEALVELVEGEAKGDGVIVLAIADGEPKPLVATLVDLPEVDLMEGM